MERGGTDTCWTVKRKPSHSEFQSLVHDASLLLWTLSPSPLTVSFSMHLRCEPVMQHIMFMCDIFTFIQSFFCYKKFKQQGHCFDKCSQIGVHKKALFTFYSAYNSLLFNVYYISMSVHAHINHLHCVLACDNCEDVIVLIWFALTNTNVVKCHHAL